MKGLCVHVVALIDVVALWGCSGYVVMWWLCGDVVAMCRCGDYVFMW